MANILVEHNEADNDAQLSTNLILQAIGFSLESNSLGYKRNDSTLNGIIEYVPSLVGNGSNGVRVNQSAHGFTLGTLIAYNPSSQTWVAANPNVGLWATHYVSRVHTATIFDAASAGTFKVPAYIAGNYGTLYLGADAKLTTVPITGAVQVVAFTDGSHVFLNIENKLNLSVGHKASNVALAEPVAGDDISIVYAKSQGFITGVSGFIHGPGVGAVQVMLYKSSSRNAGTTGTPVLSAPFLVSSKTTAQDLPASYPVSVSVGEFVYAVVTSITGAPTYLDLVVTFTGID